MEGQFDILCLEEGFGYTDRMESVGRFNPAKECGHVCECCGESVTAREVVDGRSECCGAGMVLEDEYVRAYPLFARVGE